MREYMNGLPPKQGLYDPQFEHDACGIGFVANIKGKKSNEIVRQALTILLNLDHRGGQGSETNTGDGAGILMQIPHAFLVKECARLGIDLPEPGQYGVGMLFLPVDPEERAACEQKLEEIIAEEGQVLLGWRTVPTDNSSLGEMARKAQPFIRQVFIAPPRPQSDRMAFERKLYVIRKRAEKEIRHGDHPGGKYFYFASLSASTIVYKGMLTPEQVDRFYIDLQDPAVETALALVHSRFSTNTFPSWERAHPYRYLIHNGEINTLRGNVNWMHARQAVCESELFGEDMAKILPVIDPDGSDSAMFDNCLEFLYLTGRSLPHAMMMMIPEPWQNHESMSPEKKAFYEYHSCLMEPWDGPAAMAFTDGRIIGAVLDRNGLRPSRYYVTEDDLIIMASEVGVLEVPQEKVIIKERLRPGRMLLVDTEAGRIISDDELKHQIATEHPYEEWLKEHLVALEDLPEGPVAPELDHQTVLKKQLAFGYTFEELKDTLAPMAEKGMEPVGSMGMDAPLAVLSDRPRLLYDYFKQLFAQVTNPPIDAIREEIITATVTNLGPEGNLLKPEPTSCRQIKIQTPILSNEELAKIRYLRREGAKSVTLPILFRAADGARGMEQALEDLCRAADAAIDAGCNYLILSDRGVDAYNAPIPALLALSCVNHHLVRNGRRTKASLILESGEPREVHHFAVLLGYGAGAINPYLAFETLDDMINQGMLPGISREKAIKNYIKAVTKGVVKVLSKMGISTIQSYRGAQIFEAIGLSQEFIDKYFTWTPSRVGGIGLDIVAQEALMRHQRAFSAQEGLDQTLDPGSDYQWRRNGEDHLFNPETIHLLQEACRRGDYQLYKKYAALINDQTQKHFTLRGLFKFKPKRKPIPLNEVESVESICRRFKTGAMSFGSISKEAHECLAIAMNRIGGKSNTGEGGEDPARFKPDPNGDLRRSAIKQVASGRFGVTSEYLVNADEIQIKMAQGAKPGEGGQLPGRKVYPWVAAVRHSTPGVELISPPPHHDIYSIEDLAQLIHDLKNANSNARINVKLVSEVGVGTIAAGVAKGRADVVLISGYDGGTGASPRTSIKHAGLPWELGLAETHQTLVLNNLRDRIVVEVDGKLMTGRDVVIATLLGAEEYGFATAPLVVMGCVMMRVCHMDTCPVGIATQNPELRKNFQGKPEHVVNFMRFVAQEIREIMAELGFRTIDEMVGRTDVLEVNEAIEHWKARHLDLSPLLYQPDVPETVGRYCRTQQDHGLDKSLDRRELLDICRPAIERGEKVTATLPIRNINRVVGTIVGSEITRRYGSEGLPEDTIWLKFKGSAGQSFGAFIPRGMTLELEGDANDYIGKGLSGGKIIVYPPLEAKFKPEENIIIGNVALYGATSGEAYFRGVAGERFCVRNSGAYAVVEGVGDHGCEYMTGGRVVVLGKTGRNFAAGMSGGIAYVLDEDGTFPQRCNKEMVLLERLENEREIEEVKTMITKHARYTGSALAEAVLADWDNKITQFVKVIPRDYKRMIEAIEEAYASGLTGDEALLAAFKKNWN
ncbi:glutamate synthase (NADH) large subunit [Carboxydocella sporoproducens DSM 16521]|uniref:Glutamate synthase (NADH) large subunit n=2 Tax=Carboxydocella TaxID=178898 RepID=A0A1T4PLM0_9FIRM|nr:MULTISPECIES: glutamate synthase large subunit [Carboxydocella]AVX19478.1 glutamate synthase (ferredoxin) [Carboxydocella thermautotrophica]AVX29896.1 glutamate synthase (ferredoxin) [Carboxydocella thermautotrophica]SJZ92450.1 glutamate synthase (NADH) large subunit [Carboxydocella sporoproducens DSM 16521]